MPAIRAALDGRIRRASCLAAYWEEDDFVLANPLTGRATTVSPAIAQLLGVLSDPVPLSELIGLLDAIADAETIVRRLVERDVLLVEDSPLERKDRLVAERWAWGSETRFFHFATQHVPFGHDGELQRTDLAERANVERPPAPTKTYDLGAALQLPGSFWRAAG